MKHEYLVKEKNGRLVFAPTKIFEANDTIKLVTSEIRLKIIELLYHKPMYPAELAKLVGVHEQKIYYHIKQLMKAGVLDVVEKKEIRGTTAKRYAPKHVNFSVALAKEWQAIDELLSTKRDKKLDTFLQPFFSDGVLDAKFVVGAPDPHGPHKSRARDGHYATDLALFLGRYCHVPESFSVMLDVDVKQKGSLQENLIVIGGPVTNVVASELNSHFPIKFSDEKPWGINSAKSEYTDESVGLICRIPNPQNPDAVVLYIAGIGNIGTKSAILAITRHMPQLLQTFTGQKSWGRVVQGFDLDGDGVIDSVELLE